MSKIAIELCNYAFTRLGVQNIQSFNSPTAESSIAYGIYPGARDSILVANQWGFATRLRSLVAKKDQSNSDKISYAIPSDCMIIIGCQRYIGGPKLEFNIRDSIIICNSNICLLTYTARTDEDSFPEHFKDALRSKLVALFSLSLGNNTSQYNLLSQEAERSIQNARRIETTQIGPPVFEDFSLLEV